MRHALAQIPSAILWSSLLLVTAAAPASALNKTIFAAQLNSALTQLTIYGQGFAATDRVTFGAGDVTGICNLASTTITCTTNTPVSPGEYRVGVFNPNAIGVAGQFDVFDLTVPATGPAGPAGPAGPDGRNRSGRSNRANRAARPTRRGSRVFRRLGSANRVGSPRHVIL
jgi:hypothetical protein